MNKTAIKQLADQAHTALCRNDFGTAVKCYNEILTLDANDDTALHFSAMILNFQGRHRIAFNMVKRAIDRYKCNANYYATLASIHKNLNEYPEAVAAIKIACELQPRNAINLSNAAMILADERRCELAKEIFEAAIEIEPDNPFVHFNYSLLLLSTGDYENGWKEYEWRIPFHYGEPVPVYPKDLKGKKIQILPEQGYGDYIMFSRYFKRLEDEGAEVFITCPKALSRLYNSRYCPEPDFSIRVASLASLFSDVPNEPYIKSPGIKKLDNTGFKIGIATKAVKPYNNDLHVISKEEGINIVPHPANLAFLSSFKRSLPADFIDPLISLNGIKLYNLQTDVNHGIDVTNLAHKMSDFADLADFVDQMDLVITIDTAVAHLAGAMGKKTWLLLPYDFEWRWLADKDHSHWYPSIKIFRQPKRGDWSSVQEQVLNELK